jgi:hypothetical protein
VVLAATAAEVKDMDSRMLRASVVQLVVRTQVLAELAAQEVILALLALLVTAAQTVTMVRVVLVQLAERLAKLSPVQVS